MRKTARPGNNDGLFYISGRFTLYSRKEPERPPSPLYGKLFDRIYIAHSFYGNTHDMGSSIIFY